jgi:2-polyprenyl-3-methyl-5-hydroxy-6-metoxy-1,4-benzoquinol methylase
MGKSEAMTWVQRAGKTAIFRMNASVPTRWLLGKGLIKGSVLDYGCGKGRDVDHLRGLGFKCEGYDPNHKPEPVNKLFDTVVCNYVLNTLPHSYETDVINKMRKHTKRGGTIYVSVRRDLKHEGVNCRGTYQRHVCLGNGAELIRDCSSYAIYKLEVK